LSHHIYIDVAHAERYSMNVSNQARDILKEALRLPIEDRADVAAELLRSLDESESTLSQDEIERRWTDEITRRANRALRGESVGRDSDEVLASIESKLQRR
jgi:hypothetical protein